MNHFRDSAIEWLDRRTARSDPYRKRNTRLDDTVVRAAEAVAGELGDPHRSFVTVHIAGSKGKGTTAWLTAYLLRANGLRTGLSMSPHLVDETERALIDLALPGSEEFWSSVLAVATAFDRLGLQPTYSGAMSLAAMHLFRRKSVDVAVIECGLGGGRDATGFLGAPVCALTGLELEHTVQLGDTLAEIALEKCSIAGCGSVLVSAQFSGELVQTVSRACGDRGAIVEFVPPLPEGGHPAATSAEIAHRCAELVCSLLGREFQSVTTQGVTVPGRLDLRRTGDGHTLFDGAHTLKSLSALAQELPRVFREPPVLIFGTTPPRDPELLAAPLLAATSAEKYFADLRGGTKAPRGFHAISANEAAAMLMRPGNRVVTGSFHLVGSMMGLCGLSPFDSSLSGGLP